jgi:hypothetical protein
MSPMTIDHIADTGSPKQASTMRTTAGTDIPADRHGG